MNIADFLDASITEDEAYALQAQGDKHHAFRLSPARILAECAAKRTVIGNANYTALNALAAVYKDHPDYRQDWTDAK